MLTAHRRYSRHSSLRALLSELHGSLTPRSHLGIAYNAQFCPPFRFKSAYTSSPDARCLAFQSAHGENTRYDSHLIQVPQVALVPGPHGSGSSFALNLLIHPPPTLDVSLFNRLMGRIHDMILTLPRYHTGRACPGAPWFRELVLRPAGVSELGYLYLTKSPPWWYHGSSCCRGG